MRFFWFLLAVTIGHTMNTTRLLLGLCLVSLACSGPATQGSGGTLEDRTELPQRAQSKIPEEEPEAPAPSDARYPIEKDGLWGYIDRQGEEVIPVHFDEAWEFHEGLAAVRIGERWGFVDPSGELVVPPQFVAAGNFSEGLALAFEDRDIRKVSVVGRELTLVTTRFINKNGETVIESENHCSLADSSFRHGRALVWKDAIKWHGTSYSGRGRNGYIDQTGEFVIAPTYWNAAPFSDGLARVWVDEEHCVFIDEEGSIVLEAGEFRPLDFSEGLAMTFFSAEEQGQRGIQKVGFVDQTGRVVIEPIYDRAGDFSEGLAAVAMGEFRSDGRSSKPLKWGYVDQRGKVVIDLQFDRAGTFSEGRAVIEMDGRSGYIDRSGVVVITPGFETAHEFKNGLARVTVDDYWVPSSAGTPGGRKRVPGRMAYIDREGNLVWGFAD